MDTDRKILIIDDSEIDRLVLQAMLCDEYEIVEKSDGFSAIGFLMDENEKADAIFLDISMPEMDGFQVLQFMKNSEMDNIPVFLITSEATSDNVQKAAQYRIAGFIRKPFEREDIVRRLRIHLGIIEEYELTQEDVEETGLYMKELGTLLKRHLINFREDEEHYLRLSGLMKIFLTKYAQINDIPKLDKERIEIISRAGYFCDIGFMLVPSKTVRIFKPEGEDEDSYQHHTMLGAGMIGLNHSERCRYFVQVCKEICMHHHERYDGKGFPHRITGDHNQIYTQICRLADRFDSYYMKYQEYNDRQFDCAVSDMERDRGFVSGATLALLTECREDINWFYRPTE